MHFIEYNDEANEYKIRIGIIHKAFSLIPIFMFCAGLKILFSMAVNYKDLEPMDYVGFLFVSFWTIGVFFIGKSVIKMLTSDLIINSDGITTKSILGRDFLSWAEVEDYGLSYDGHGRNGKTYSLYFSKKYKEAKNERSKNLKGKMLRYIIYTDSYLEIKEKIIPFCKTFCPIEPFVCEE